MSQELINTWQLAAQQYAYKSLSDCDRLKLAHYNAMTDLWSNNPPPESLEMISQIVLEGQAVMDKFNVLKQTGLYLLAIKSRIN